MPDRAIFFVDGSNWYHACKTRGVRDLFALDYVKISQKLAGPREWVGTRYYIGALKQGQPAYPDQRRFLSRLRNSDSRITIHLGRIEPRPVPNELSTKLLEYLARTAPSLDAEMVAHLSGLARQHALVSVFKEKETDVQLAIDMYKLAVEDKFDACYLLSADGDFAPAVEAVRSLDKKVYVACPSPGLALQNVANRFIRLQPAWFQACYRFD